MRTMPAVTLGKMCLLVAIAGALAACGDKSTPQATATATPLPTAEIHLTPTQQPTEITPTEQVSATPTALASGGVKVNQVVSGTIRFTEDNRLSVSAGQPLPEASLSDFIAEAKFYNPDIPSEKDWSYGFICRLQNASAHVVLVRSANTWRHTVLIDGTEQAAVEGEYDVVVAKEPNESNTLRIVVIGDQGQLWINGQFAARLDMSGLTSPGNVLVTIGGEPGEYDRATHFEDFAVWSLD